MTEENGHIFSTHHIDAIIEDKIKIHKTRHSLRMTSHSWKGRGPRHVTFWNFGALCPIFGKDEARQFKFGEQINYNSGHNSSPGVTGYSHCPKGSGSHDNFKFSGISNNIWKTVLFSRRTVTYLESFSRKVNFCSLRRFTRTVNLQTRTRFKHVLINEDYRIIMYVFFL